MRIAGVADRDPVNSSVTSGLVVDHSQMRRAEAGVVAPVNGAAAAGIGESRGVRTAHVGEPARNQT